MHYLFCNFLAVSLQMRYSAYLQTNREVFKTVFIHTDWKSLLFKVIIRHRGGKGLLCKQLVIFLRLLVFIKFEHMAPK